MRHFLYYSAFLFSGISFDYYLGTYGIANNFMSVIFLCAAYLFFFLSFFQKDSALFRIFLRCFVFLSINCAFLAIGSLAIPSLDIPANFSNFLNFTLNPLGSSSRIFFDILYQKEIFAFEAIGKFNESGISIYKAYPTLLFSLLIGFLLKILQENLPRKRLILLLFGLILFAFYGLLLVYLAMLSIITFGHVWVSWVLITQIILFLPLIAILSSKFFIFSSADENKYILRSFRRGGTIAFFIGLSLVMCVFFLKPCGIPKKNLRILVDDSHCNWEKASVKFQETSFSKIETYAATLFYRSLKPYGDVKIHMDLNVPINSKLLQGYDVLIIKTPTSPFLENEIDDIVDFVKNGGGLFVIGDHTNLFGMTTNLNKLIEKFSLRFEYDAEYAMLTGQTSVYRKLFWNTDPASASIDNFNFLTGCTLKAPIGSASMIGCGLCSESVEYSHVNQFGNMKADLKDNWGNFIQMASVYYGRGRIVAFTDSTYMSNFCYNFDNRSNLTYNIIGFLSCKSNSLYSSAYAFIQAYFCVWILLMLVGIIFSTRKSILIISMIFPYMMFGISLCLEQKFTEPNFNKYHPRKIICVDTNLSVARYASGFLASPKRDKSLYYDQFISNFLRKDYHVHFSPSNKCGESDIKLFVLPPPAILFAKLSDLLKTKNNIICLFNSNNEFSTAVLERFGLKLKLLKRIPFSKGKVLFEIELYIYENTGTESIIAIVNDNSLFSEKHMGEVYDNSSKEIVEIAKLHFEIVKEIETFIKK